MKLKRAAIFRNILASLLVTISCFCVLCLTVFLSFNITHIKTLVYSVSMQPTLNLNVTSDDEPGDIVYINKYADLKVGDIVVVQTTWKTDALVKRLVGTPGDNVLIKQNDDKYELIVNGNVLYTREVSSQAENNTTKKYLEFKNYLLAHPECVITDQRGNKCLHLSDDQYLLIGDNWCCSFDSLSSSANGPISKSQIYGNVDVIQTKGVSKKFDLIKSILKILF